MPGAVTLDGALQAALVDGFDPPPGSVFTLITGSSITGQFSTLQLPALTGGKYLQLMTTPTAVSLVVLPEPALAGGAALLLPLLRRRSDGARC